MLKSDLKKRNWTFVLYDDSCAKDWEEYLISTGVPFSYAYHDKDFTEIGEVKKPHYHVLICFDGPTTYNTMLEHAKRVGAANDVIQPVGSVRGIVRYFCHKDNPEKYQYDEQEIVCLNGFDSENFVAMTTSQIKMIVRELTDIILTKNILEYVDLIDFLMCNEMYDFLDVASSKTIYFNTLIPSLRNKSKFNVSRETL